MQSQRQTVVRRPPGELQPPDPPGGEQHGQTRRQTGAKTVAVDGRGEKL